MIENSTPLKVLIAEDHELARTGLSFAIQSNIRFNVVAETSDGIETLQQVEKTIPDVVLMDIDLPLMDGIAATQKIKELHPNTKVIMLTSQTNKQLVLASLAAGAEAYCLKDIHIEHLFGLIDMIAAGGVWLDPQIAKIVMEYLPQNGGVSHITIGDSSKPLHNGSEPHFGTHLTERELEVLGYLVEGKSNKEIAPILHISPHTVKTYVCNILQKLAVDDRTQAAVKALQDGLLPSRKVH